MNIEAFNQLLRVLANVRADEKKRAAFSLVDWITLPFDDDLPVDLNTSPSDLTGIPHQCGTSACACGYAGLDNWFRTRGFLTLSDGTLSYVEKESKQEYLNWNAVAEFFQINEDDAIALFSHDSYREDVDPDSDEYEVPVPVEDVIRRVEAFIQ